MQTTVEQALQTALQHHRAGQLQQAEQIYRQVLAADPNNADALNLFGVLAHQLRRDEIAVQSITRAIAVRPEVAEFHFNRGEALYAMGRFAEAMADFQKTLEIQPENAEAWNDLGITQHASEQLGDAEKSLRRAVELRPESAQAHNNLGAVLRAAERFDEAIEIFIRAATLNPEFVEAHYNLGTTLMAAGKIDEAIASLKKATELRPDYFQAYINLSHALEIRRSSDEAVAAARKAVELRPDSADAFRNLGTALQRQGKLSEGAISYAQGLKLRPHDAALLSNLGTALMAQARHAEALVCLHEAVEFNPREAAAHSNVLLAMHYIETDPQKIFDEHLHWSRLHEEPLRESVAPHPNTRVASRKIRVGFVSPDFREHPVAHFIEPLWTHHDRGAMEIIAYNDLAYGDAATDRLKFHASEWREVFRMSDERFAQLVRDDSIDILIDLAGHSANNRMLAFARKPAPIQVTYLGYPDTTGLKAMDYRITDALSDPPGAGDAFYTERLLRLPTAWCYRAMAESPQVRPPPVTSRGFVTFGSFNNLAKLSPGTVGLWTKVLTAVPDSRLLLKARALCDAPTCERVKNLFVEQGIASERIELRAHVRGVDEHLRQYQDIDIALDTYPYHGTTTTCDALWMGVPVVTLAGARHVSRVGQSLLTNVALAELVANTTDEYVELASALAGDSPRMQKLRADLRRRMTISPLSDAVAFTRDFEAILRHIWRQWCEGETP